MDHTFLWIPVNPLASPKTDVVSSLEKRKLHTLTSDLNITDPVRSQIEWILSFNISGKLNIQPTDKVTKLAANWSIHQGESAWIGVGNALYLILREWATQEILEKCAEVTQITPLISKFSYH